MTDHPNRAAIALQLLLLAASCALGGTVPFQTGAVFGPSRVLEGDCAKSARAVALEGDRLYVGGRGFVAVYDVGADPARPKLLGRTDDISTVRQLAVQDGLVYSVTRADGLWITDCRDPKAPRTVGHLPLTLNATGVDVAGNVCFVGGSRSGIGFVDVSDPTRPQLAAVVRQEPVESQSVAYRNGFLYSGEWNAKCVSVWECRDLTKIRRVTQPSLPSNGDGVWPAGKWLYACTGWNTEDKKPDARPRSGQMGLSVFDIADPVSPRAVGRVDFEWCKGAGLDMWIPRSGGDLVFCAQNLSGLYAVDVSDRTRPRVLDRWILPAGRGEAFAKRAAAGQPSKLVASVAVGDGVVYLAGGGDDVGARVVMAKGAKRETVDRGAPPVNWTVRPQRPPVPAGFQRWLPSNARQTAVVTGAAVRGDTCYAACGTAGLYVLALSETGIVERASIPLSECMDVSVAGNRLFAAAGREGFVGYEIGPDGVLTEFMRIKAKGARDVYAYGDGRRWLVCNASAHDISDPAHPVSLGPLFHQSRWDKFVGPDLIAGRWLISNSALTDFRWADLSSPTPAPIPIRGYKSRTGCACAFGDRVFLADNGAWCVLEPGATEMPELRPFPRKGCAGGVPRVSGTIVAMTAGKAVGLWDFGDLSRPRHIRDYSLPEGAEPVTFWRGRLVVPGWTAGVLVSDVVK